jgi:hypothetical protein
VPERVMREAPDVRIDQVIFMALLHYHPLAGWF